MSKNKNQIKANEEEIVRLHDVRRSVLSNITNADDEKDFMARNRECINLLGKINVLEKKNSFMKQNLPPNGVGDFVDEVTMLK